jgi:site-specific DNA-methyltransferase (adenine-specific)
MTCAIEDAGFEIRDQIQWIYGTGFPKSMDISKAIDKQLGNQTERYWDGWGTALKPANEPICMARKPIEEKTVAENVLRWGTGCINIDACRIQMSKEDKDTIEKKASKNPTDNYQSKDYRKYGAYGGSVTIESTELSGNVLIVSMQSPNHRLHLSFLKNNSPI